MKKIITVILSLIMVISLFACDGDGSKSTYKGEFFDGIITLKIDGDTVNATVQNSFVENGTTISLTVNMLGGKATVSGDKLSADFSEVNYELRLDISGADKNAYVESLKSELLEAFENEKDKKLVNDLIDGKTITFGSDSPLKMLADGFVSLKATLISSTGKLLPTEIAYEEGSKWVYEYYDNGHMKSESHYNSDGSFAYKNDFENPDPDNGSGNNSSSDNQNPDQGNNNENNQGNSQSRPGDSSNEEGDDKLEGSGGNLSGGNVVIGGLGEVPVGEFIGTYEGKEAYLNIEEGNIPVLTLVFKGEESGVMLEQWFNITNGKIIIGAKDTAIIDFGVDDIRYSSKMTITGENAEQYMREVLDQVEASDMSEDDKSLYRDLVLGREIYFGTEAELYNGVKLGTIKFTIDTKKGEFTAQDVQIAIGGGSLSGNDSISGEKDPDYSDKNEDDNTGEDKYPMSSDEDTYYPMPGTTEKEDIITPDVEIIIPNVSDYDDDTKYEIDISDGVMFYMIGTFNGKYSGMDAVIDFPKDKQPVFTITAEMSENGADIKQTITVNNGKLIYHNGVLAIIDFTVEDISYTMQMEITGSGAATYKQQMLNNLSSSGMTDSDKNLYQDALDGKEIKFGKESEIYKGIKLPMIKFKLDDKTLTFESERFDPDENQGGGKLESSTGDIYDSLTNIGSNSGSLSNNNNGDTATKDPNAGYRTETEKER